MQRRFLSPDGPADPPAGNPTETSGVPKADLGLLAVAEAVAAKWTATPAITLAWKTSAANAADVAAYRTALTGRIASGATRPGHTYKLRTLDQQINDAVKEVKIYIDRKFKSAAGPAQYPRYGIVKENGAYILPRDRQARLEALAQMKAAITEDDFENEEFGKDFWLEKTEAYGEALTAAQSADSLVSSGTASKNTLKREIKKVMTALRFVLRGNYPDTYAEVYRAWGWQKEDY